MMFTELLDGDSNNSFEVVIRCDVFRLVIRCDAFGLVAGCDLFWLGNIW